MSSSICSVDGDCDSVFLLDPKGSPDRSRRWGSRHGDRPGSRLSPGVITYCGRNRNVSFPSVLQGKGGRWTVRGVEGSTLVSSRHQVLLHFTLTPRWVRPATYWVPSKDVDPPRRRKVPLNEVLYSDFNGISLFSVHREFISFFTLLYKRLTCMRMVLSEVYVVLCFGFVLSSWKTICVCPENVPVEETVN